MLEKARKINGWKSTFKLPQFRGGQLRSNVQYVVDSVYPPVTLLASIIMLVNFIMSAFLLSALLRATVGCLYPFGHWDVLSRWCRPCRTCLRVTPHTQSRSSRGAPILG